jgi:hypothetical protein
MCLSRFSGNKSITSATSSFGTEVFTKGRVVMDDEKLLLYESLVRASLMLIFVIALSVGTFGLIVISRMFMQQAVTNSRFFGNHQTLAESVR